MTDPNELVINDERVALGEQAVIRLNIGRLPSGTRIFIYLHIYRSERPGPVLLALAGLHGDEINGVEIIRRGITQGIFETIETGTVIAVPLLNIFGFINYSRDVPDGKDVNRSFPGSLRGSLASRVAKTLSQKVLPHVSFGVDFHTGGSSRYNYPQIRYTKGDDGSKEIADLFEAPFIIEKGGIRGSLRRHAREMGIPIVVFEGGEALRFDGLAIENGLQGLQRLMARKGMLSGVFPAWQPSREIIKTSWVRAAESGLFIWFKSSGQRIVKGEPLGQVCEPYGQRRYVVKSKHDGYIIGHNNAPVVHQGDALFHIGVA